jgi:hypothetical protein
MCSCVLVPHKLIFAKNNDRHFRFLGAWWVLGRFQALKWLGDLAVLCDYGSNVQSTVSCNACNYQGEGEWCGSE